MIQLKNRAIGLAAAALEEAERKLRETVAAEQIDCRHVYVAEAPPDSAYGHREPAVRICLDCGLTEEGPGYAVLMDRNDGLGHPTVSNSTVVRIRRGMRVGAEERRAMKGSSKSLRDLIIRKLENER